MGVLKLLCLIIITIDWAQTTDGAGDDDAAIGWYQEIGQLDYSHMGGVVSVHS